MWKVMFLGDKFDNRGVIVMASSKRSLRIELRDMPFSCPYYVSIKDLEAVLKGHKKSATIWMPKEYR